MQWLAAGESGADIGVTCFNSLMTECRHLRGDV